MSEVDHQILLGARSRRNKHDARTSKPRTEITRTDTKLAFERALQSAFRAKYCLVCNLRKLQSRRLQQGPSKLASQLLDRFGGSGTCDREEFAVKGACRLAGSRCKCLDAPSGS